jgi:D-amino-acid oxidase
MWCAYYPDLVRPEGINLHSTGLERLERSKRLTSPDRAAHVDVAVIGAGIIGLSAAVALAQSGFTVRVITRQEPLETTSANAGAIWGPFLSSTDERLRRWSYETLEVLKSLASESLRTGIEMVAGLGAEPHGSFGRWWVEDFKDSVPCPGVELPPGYDRGWYYTAPIVDVPAYLNCLVDRILHFGCLLEIGSVENPNDLLRDADHVVVCAGMGSAVLAADSTLRPAKGQLVVVENPGISRFFAERGDGPDLTYILPQREKVILGGTAEWTFENEDSDPAITEAIISRCALVEPKLESAAVLSTRIGVRACRDTVRVEHSANHIIYNYGHGGSGISVSWGCAIEVVDLIAACCGAPSGRGRHDSGDLRLA